MARVLIPLPPWKLKGWRCVGTVGRTWFGELSDRDPVEAKRVLLDAVDNSGGRIVSAANELGMSRRWVLHFAHKLEAWPEIDAIRARHGMRQGIPIERQSTRVDAARVA